MLNFGHRNALHGVLRELALQIEELQWLIQRPADTCRIIRVKNVHGGPERDRVLALLAKLGISVRDMCSACDLALDEVDADHRLRSTAEYLRATIKYVKPERLRGYGALDREDRELLNFHIDRFLSILKELQEDE